MKWDINAFVHVFENPEKTAHKTIMITIAAEENQTFTIKGLIDKIKAEVVRRKLIFDYMVHFKIKQHFDSELPKKVGE